MIAEYKIDFMGKRRIAAIFSGVLVVISLGSLLFNSLQFGLDFTSGTSVRLTYAEAIVVPQVNEMLRDNGYEDAVVVTFGSDRDIRILLPVDEEVAPGEQAAQALVAGEKIVDVLREASGMEIQLLGSDYVSAKVGEELAEQGGLGMLVALGIIMIYIAVRFQFKFSVGAVAALAHDVIITLGVFSVFRLEFDLTVLAALLAVIGYSLNDTIVVSDRIRENFRRMRVGTPEEMINTSLNQTLSRTLITSLTTLLVLVTTLIVGGESIRGFALALTIGVVIGTYSSIYISSSTLLFMKVTREDLMAPVKEGEELDGMP
ncbi:MAG: protein translocase subunit SecF [Gammaproteobacteria bacterium]|nr:protein translocase subunit SecF [Gammaproteobacteria bacterium]